MSPCAARMVRYPFSKRSYSSCEPIQNHPASSPRTMAKARKSIPTRTDQKLPTFLKWSEGFSEHDKREKRAVPKVANLFEMERRMMRITQPELEILAGKPANFRRQCPQWGSSEAQRSRAPKSAERFQNERNSFAANRFNGAAEPSLRICYRSHDTIYSATL